MDKKFSRIGFSSEERVLLLFFQKIPEVRVQIEMLTRLLDHNFWLDGAEELSLSLNGSFLSSVYKKCQT